MMAAECYDLGFFGVEGDYGTDGDGNSLAYSMNYEEFTGYNHRIYGTSDSSINEIILFTT